MTKTGVVRPWSDVAWDLARTAGVDPDAVTDELERLTDDDWDREAALLEQLNTGLATKLWQDLLNGAVIARDVSGKLCLVRHRKTPIGAQISRLYGSMTSTNGWPNKAESTAGRPQAQVHRILGSQSNGNRSRRCWLKFSVKGLTQSLYRQTVVGLVG